MPFAQDKIDKDGNVADVNTREDQGTIGESGGLDPETERVALKSEPPRE